MDEQTGKIPTGMWRPVRERKHRFHDDLNIGMCFLVAGIIGVTVIAGWRLQIPALVQINQQFVPMQFNTALAFVGICIAGVSLQMARFKLATSIAAFIGGLAALTLIQYIAGVNLNIDELFQSHSIVTNTSHPGRMAPNTAVSFLAITVALISLSAKRVRGKRVNLASALISSTLALSLVSLGGYIFDIEASYSWGGLTHMAVHTALGILLFSIGLLALLRQKTALLDAQKYHLPVLVGALCFSTTLLLTHVINSHQQQSLEREREASIRNIKAEALLAWKGDLLALSRSVYQDLLSDTSTHIGQTELAGIADMVILEAGGAPLKVLARTRRHDELLTRIPAQSFRLLENSKISRMLNVQYASFNDSAGSPFLAMRLPVPEALGISRGLVIVLSYDKWVSAYIDNALNNEARARALRPGQSARAMEHVIALPYLSVAVEYLEGPLATRSNLPHVVFLSGIIFSLVLVALSWYFQKARYKSAVLNKEIETRKAIEQELKKSNLSISLASDTALLGIWTWNRSTGALEWNERMIEIYEVPEEIRESGLYYDYWYECVHPEDRSDAAGSLNYAVENNTKWTTVFRLLLPGGRIKYVQATATQTIDEQTGEAIVVGGNLDITKERQLVHDLKVQTALAEQSSVAKSRFLANMSHEIRTPMNAILGIGELLQQTRLSAKQTEYMSLVMNSANQLLDLLNDILDLSKIEAGQLSIETVCFPIEEVIGKAVKSQANQAHMKGLDYYYFFSSELPKWVESDPVRLGQIVNNLVSNAIKFTERGEVSVEVLHGDDLESGQALSICIRVSDTGIGMSPAFVDNLFKPFSQADDSTTRRYGGTGLGLSIIKQLVALFDGKIEVDSEIGKGTTIEVTVPVREGEQKNATIPASKDYENYLHSDFAKVANRRILVIEDHERSRRWLIKILHSWNCNVASCASVEHAVYEVQRAKGRGKPFDAVIIDDDFNKSSAKSDLYKEAHNSNLQLLFFLSTRQLDTNLEEVQAFSNATYLVKPIKQSELYNALVALFEGNPSVTNGSAMSGLGPAKKALKLLLVEDNQVNQLLIRELLENRGHTVQIAENGREGVEAVKASYFDAVMMDVQMPVMDGVDATEAIRQLPEHNDVFIIGLTAKAFKEDEQQCLEAGMDKFLTKPVDPELLVRTIELGERIQKASAVKTPPQGYQPLDTGKKVLDASRALMYCGADAGLLHKVLSLAYQYIPEVNSDIDTLYQEQKWHQLARRIHKAKGMVTTFCQPTFQQELESIIEQLDTHAEAVTSKAIESVKNGFAQLQCELEEVISEMDSEPAQ
ncbi:response regulator [Alteromonas sp. ASW11-19]|uniref:histidine kinase n=1 Tax=Alteromonas salexigens TaxID=2982530 RepID=A0ABT2VPI5_9ALTE|nr:response regulator [Alteromonas salexigens]MCU7555231.1 response regulator [Alteromonas salexigens]